MRGIWRRTFLDEYVKEIPGLGDRSRPRRPGRGRGRELGLEGRHRPGPGLPALHGGPVARRRRRLGRARVRHGHQAFVEDGFFVPEAKAHVAWKDENTLWIGTDFGEGSLTESGYPRFVKEWKRGTDLEEASTIFEGPWMTWPSAPTAYTRPRGDTTSSTGPRSSSAARPTSVLDERLVKIEIPEDAELQGIFKDQMLIALRTDWTVGGTTYPADALLAIDVDDFLAGGRELRVLFEPEERFRWAGVRSTRNHLLITTLDNVRGRLYQLHSGEGRLDAQEVELPGLGTVGIVGTSDVDDDFFFTYTDFLTPSSLYFVRDGTRPKRSRPRRRSSTPTA